MSYEKQTWADDESGGTPLSATRLNHMEDGIEAATWEWRGAWDGGVEYVINDAVSHNGASYIALEDNVGIVPSDDVGQWGVLASRGGEGNDSPQVEGEWEPGAFTGEEGPFYVFFEGSTYFLPIEEVDDGSTPPSSGAPWLVAVAEGAVGPAGPAGPAGADGGGGAGFPGLTHFGGLVPLSSRSVGYESVSFTDGDQSMSRIKHVPLRAGGDVRFVFGNWCTGLGINTLAVVTVTAALESPFDWKVPITFSGRREIDIDPGGFVLSDPIAIDFPGPEFDFNYFYVRTFVVTAGKFPTIYGGIHSGDSVEYGTGLTDKTMSGTVGGDGSGLAYGPCAILTNTVVRRPIVAVIGDSISAGSGDTASPQKPAGYPMRALDTAGLGGLVNAKAAQRATDLQGFSSGQYGSGLWGTSNPSGFNWFFALAGGASHVIHQYGVNDLYAGGTAAVLKVTLAMNWGWLAGRGLAVYQPTITPITTSSDGWATAENQTFYTADFQTARVAVNDWIRAGGPLDPDDLAPVAIGTPGALVVGDEGHPLTGYFEVADAAESARNSGKWKAGYTSDGIHPNVTGSQALALAVDTDVFV